MFLFIFLLILGVVGAACVVGSLFMKKPEKKSSYDTVVYRWPFAAGGVVLILVSLFSILGMMFTVVGTSDTGIKTAFGHTQGGDLGPGVHLVAPWQNVTVWDGSVQHYVFQGTHNDKTNTGCLVVRIAGQQQACLDVNIWAKDSRPAADQQFVNYRTFPRLQAAYFSRGVLVQYFNNVFERFDPVALSSRTGAGLNGGQDVSALTGQVAANLRAAYTGQFQIIRVTTSSPRYSADVEIALNQIVKAKAGTNVALQNEQTARDQAAANKLLAQQQISDAVWKQNCLTVTQNIIQGGGTMPPAWNCSGSGSGVLVSGK